MPSFIVRGRLIRSNEREAVDAFMSIPGARWAELEKEKEIETETVTFNWSTKHGKCYDCGLPAAFYSGPVQITPLPEEILCAVCAANRASDGEDIHRMEEV